MPPYRRIITGEGTSRPAELAVIGDENTIAAAVRRYLDAGATEVVFTQTDLGSAADQQRTWTTLSEIAAALPPT